MHRGQSDSLEHEAESRMLKRQNMHHLRQIKKINIKKWKWIYFKCFFCSNLYFEFKFSSCSLYTHTWLHINYPELYLAIHYWIVHARSNMDYTIQLTHGGLEVHEIQMYIMTWMLSAFFSRSCTVIEETEHLDYLRNDDKAFCNVRALTPTLDVKRRIYYTAFPV